jgi:hypothetical protein
MALGWVKDEVWQEQSIAWRQKSNTKSAAGWTLNGPPSTNWLKTKVNPERQDHQG